MGRATSGVWQCRYMYTCRVCVSCTSGSFACFCIPARRSFPSQRAAVERPTSRPLLHMVRKRTRSAAHVRVNTRLQHCTDDVHHADNTCRARCVGDGDVDWTWIMTVMWLWRPHHIHSNRLRKGKSEATRPAITPRSLRCDRRSSSLAASPLYL